MGTLHRKRPSEDWVELATYWCNRRIKTIHYHWANAYGACRLMLRGSVGVALCVRITCMLLRSSSSSSSRSSSHSYDSHSSIFGQLQSVLDFGQGGGSLSKAQMFAKSAGIRVEELLGGTYSDTHYSSWLVASGLRWTTGQFFDVAAVRNVGSSVCEMWLAWMPLLRRL